MSFFRVELVDGTTYETLHVSPSFSETTELPQVTVFTGGRARAIPASDVNRICILPAAKIRKPACPTCGLLPQLASKRHKTPVAVMAAA